MVVVALLIFGPSKVPEFGKSIGEVIRGSKKSANDADNAPSESRLRQRTRRAQPTPNEPVSRSC